jgi:hypothetical protein
MYHDGPMPIPLSMPSADGKEAETQLKAKVSRIEELIEHLINKPNSPVSIPTPAISEVETTTSFNPSGPNIVVGVSQPTSFH